MAATKPRIVDGPEKDYLDADEVAAYLHMSVETLRRLVKKGQFPQPLEMSERVRVWSWRDVLFWALTIEVKPRLVPDSGEKSHPHGASGRGHGATNDEPDESPA